MTRVACHFRICGFSLGESEILLGNHQNNWFCKVFHSKHVTRGTKDQRGRRNARSPPRTQGVILDPQGVDVLTRHLWGGRIEDACGEVTGHPSMNCVPYSLLGWFVRWLLHFFSWEMQMDALENRKYTYFQWVLLFSENCRRPP